MKWRSVLVFSVILIAGISIGIGLRVLRLEKISATLQSVIPAPDARAGRAIYPYSLIPGGVRNSYELSQSIAHDPVLAGHYRDVRPAAMFPLRLTSDTEGYVSYRVGNQIYWTHHLVRIRKGELVLTDGFRMIRGRCGNQIVPAYLRPKGIPTTLDPMEPPPVVFESGYPPVMTLPPDQVLLAEKNAPPIPATPGTSGGGTPPAFWPPLVPPVAWCCSGSTQTGTPPPVPPTSGGGGDTPVPPVVPPVTPVTPVPEPGTLLMVGAGLAALKLFSARRD
jgi:PEP-CTERM motif